MQAASSYEASREAVLQVESEFVYLSYVCTKDSRSWTIHKAHIPKDKGAELERVVGGAEQKIR